MDPHQHASNQRYTNAWERRGTNKGCIRGFLLVFFYVSYCVVDRYPIQKVTEIYKKDTLAYKKVTELEDSSWNVLSLLWS
jgi:hypothetical protein